MSIDGIRAVDKEPLASIDYAFGYSNIDGQRIGPRPISMMAVAQQITALLPNGAVKSYASVAAMNADVTPAAGTLAYAEGKTYRKTAASGSAGWEVFLDFIPGTQVVPAAVTGGTANAVVATSATPISATPGQQIINIGPFTADNGAGGMTLSINGEAPRSIVLNQTGSVPVPENYVRKDTFMQAVRDSAGNYRLYSYGDASAIQAAVEAALVEFKSIYLGAFANDAAATAAAGGTPMTGAEYWNTTVGKRRTYSGSVWEDTSTSLDDGDVTEPKLAGALALSMAPVMTNVAAVKSLSTARYNTAMTADGRLWAWKAGDFSSQVAADTTEGVFAKANAVAATSGAWVVNTDGKVHSSWFGAIGDRVAGSDGVISSGGNTYTSASAAWTSDDIGKVFVAHGAGAAGATLYTTIASVNSATSVELADAAGTEIASAGVYSYGTDNTMALQKWLDIAQMADQRGYLIAWLDPGAYIVTGTIQGRVYVSLDGAGVRWSVIFPAMIDGPALSHDAALSGCEAGYHQFMHHIGFDGSDATGSAQAYTIGGNSKMVDISQNMFWNFNRVDDGTYAAEFRGAGYGVDFLENHFLDNKRHYRCVRIAGSGNFPTASSFMRNLVEFATEATGTACLWQDTSGMVVYDNRVQSNNSLNTLMFYQTSAAETAAQPVCDNNWMEANGAGIAGSKAIYAVSDDAPLIGAKIRDNKFHGADAAYKIELNNTDYARVSGNNGGDGTGYGVKRSGTNTNFVISADGLTGTVDV